MEPKQTSVSHIRLYSVIYQFCFLQTLQHLFQVLLKVDLGGNALEVDLKRVFASKNFVNFDMEKFRRMCILSGCDYLPDGLPGVGVKRAFKVFQTAMSNDVTVVSHKASLLFLPK